MILKAHLGLAGPECQHVVTDEFLCMVFGCALETDVCLPVIHVLLYAYERLKMLFVNFLSRFLSAQ